MLGLLAEKFVKDPAVLKRIKELISVGVIFDMLSEDIREDERIEIARKLLKRGMSISAVVEDTGLPESAVHALKAELDKESEKSSAVATGVS